MAEQELAEATEIIETELDLDAEEQKTGEEETSDDELVVTIGDESPTPEEEEQAAAPQWVKELRKTSRDDKKEIRALRKRLEARDEQKPTQLGPKPTLADFDHDEDQYSAAHEKWLDDKRKNESQEATAKTARDNADKAWGERLEHFEETKKQLKVPDYEEAEDTVKETFNETQQGIMVQGAANPAVLVYALGKNPKKAAELSKITDPVKFAFAVAKLETQLKTGTRKKPPTPDTKVKGTSGSTTDRSLEKLEEEAVKSGDRTKVIAYKRKLKQQAA